MPDSATDVLVHDPWLSGQLAVPAFRVSDIAEPAAINSLEGACFVFGKVPVDDVRRAQQFEAAGFRLVDVNVAFEKLRGIVPGTPQHLVRDATPRDEDAVAAIAASSFRWTRFHQDPAIPRERADAIKAEWTRNFFRGQRGDCGLVAECGGVVAGFLIALVHGDTVTTDLIACALPFQRRGIARALMTALEARFPAATRLRVGTQLANLPSFTLYTSLGYRVISSSYVFHFHRASV